MPKAQVTRYEELQALAGSRGTRHYFVDEAGDLTLFDRRKRIIVGKKEGVSWCFMVGLLDLPAPDYAHQELEGLRLGLSRRSELRERSEDLTLPALFRAYSEEKELP